MAENNEDVRLEASRVLRALLVQDLQTGTAWALRRNFDHFWSYRQRGRACRFVHHWMEAVFATGLQPLEKAAEMIGQHAKGILNYIFHRITNAASEGINSPIQSLKHAARGLPAFKTLRNRVLFFLGKLDLSPVYIFPADSRSAQFISQHHIETAIETGLVDAGKGNSKGGYPARGSALS